MPPCWAPNAREGEKADFTWEGHTAAATVKDSLGKEVHLEEPTPGAHLPHKARASSPEPWSVWGSGRNRIWKVLFVCLLGGAFDLGRKLF